MDLMRRVCEARLILEEEPCDIEITMIIISSVREDAPVNRV